MCNKRKIYSEIYMIKTSTNGQKTLENTLKSVSSLFHEFNILGTFDPFW